MTKSLITSRNERIRIETDNTHRFVRVDCDGDIWVEDGDPSQDDVSAIYIPRDMASTVANAILRALKF